MVWLCVLPQIQGLSFTPGLAAFAFWGVRNSFGNLIKALEPLPRRIHEFGGVIAPLFPLRASDMSPALQVD